MPRGFETTPLSRVLNIVAGVGCRVGERLGWDWLTYNPAVTAGFHRAALKDAPRVVQAVLEQFPGLKSVADVGCGTGVFARRFMDKGLRVTACEYGARGRRWARRQGVTCVPFDVSKDDSGLEGRPYDLVMSLEVAEHIPEPLADAFVNYLVNTGPLVVLTAAYPGQGGNGHINEQPQSYWIEKMAARGFVFDSAATKRLSRRLCELDAVWYLYENVMVFRRGAHNSHTVSGIQRIAGSANR